MACTYRGHAAVLAKGAPLDASFAEILGKDDGPVRGKGGSMHLTDMQRRRDRLLRDHRRPPADRLRHRLGRQLYKGCRTVSLVASSATARRTSAPFTSRSTWRRSGSCRSIFVCENNLYGEYSPIATRRRSPSLAERADSYGMPGVRIDGNDISVVHQTVTEAVAARRVPARARRYRGDDLPPQGPLARRSGRLPARRRARALAGARPAAPARARSAWPQGVEQERLDAMRVEAEKTVADGAGAGHELAPTQRPSRVWRTSTHEHDSHDHHHLPRCGRPGDGRRDGCRRRRLPARRGRRRRRRRRSS